MRSAVDVVLVAAEDERHRAHHVQVHLAGYYPRPRRHLELRDKIRLNFKVIRRRILRRQIHAIFEYFVTPYRADGLDGPPEIERN